MECPKCGLEIDDSAIVCPNCKKVLKVICPICKTVNDANTCKKCGYVIITKCNNCGKINPTANKVCSKCKFSLEQSVILNESNVDEFAIMTLEFPNLSEIKNLLGSAKMFNKFKFNLDKILVDYTKTLHLRRQVIDKTYVIRFYKDYTFNSSVNSSIAAAIEIINVITKLNSKLMKKKNTTVRCNISLLKRTVQDDPNNCQSGYNISIVNQNSDDKTRVLNSFQILTDESIYEILNPNYKLEPLNSVLIDGEMKMFYELDAKSLIKKENLIVEKDDSDEDSIKIPNFVQNMLEKQDEMDGLALQRAESPFDPDAIYDMESINFNELHCKFVRAESIDVVSHVLSRLKSVPMGILAIKAQQMYLPYSLKIIQEAEKLKIYENIITLTCYDEMKYSPYSFFRDLVSAIFEYTVSQKLFNNNDFSAFASVDPQNLIRDLITLSEREIADAIDTRNEYYDIFLTLLGVIPNTLIFIENFDKIDASSYEVMKYLFESFDQLQISYLLTYDKDYSLHKDLHLLLSRDYYEEISLKPTPFNKIIEGNKQEYSNILDDFYFQRIAKYSCGSALFLDVAIQYLIESGVYELNNGCIEMVNSETIIIPSNLNKLFRRRLNLLKDDPDAMRFLASVLLLGTRVDLPTINSLGYKNVEKIIEKLTYMGYIYFYNNCMYFPNYNLLRENLLEVMNKIDLQKIANELFSKVFVDNMPSPVKSYLYTLLSDTSNAFLEWEKLAKINLALGDYNSYLNCSAEIIKLLDSTELSEVPDVEAYKMNLYEHISQNLYEYVPEKSQEIAELTLKSLENSTDIDNTIMLCNKMIQGALSTGKYNHALGLTHKVLSLIPNASINPDLPNYSIYFFLVSLVYIEILFNIGAFDECLDVGYKVLNVVNNANYDKLKPSYMSDEDFKRLICDSVGYIAIASIIQLRANISEFLKIVYDTIEFVPKSFDIFVKLQEFVLGKEVSVSEDMIGHDNFSKIIYHIINAFNQFKDEPEAFAEEIYQAKLTAKDNHVPQLETFCDLMIGYAYIKLDLHKKAASILYKIIKSVKQQGMNLMLHIGWLCLSEMNIREKKYDLAYGMLNNSVIQLQKNDKSSEYLMMFLKYNMFKVLMFKGQIEQAQICLNQAYYIAQRYNINFEFDVNPEHYFVSETMAEETDNVENTEGLEETVVENAEDTVTESEE